MYSLIFSPTAQTSLTLLHRYIAVKSSTRIADAYLMRIRKDCRSLCLAPYRGRSYETVRPGLRVVGFERRASIIFKVSEEHKMVTILEVFYGGRSVKFETDQ